MNATLIAMLITVMLLLTGCGGDRPVADEDPVPPTGGPEVAATVSGTVRAADGAPVAAASVQPEALGQGQPVPDLAVVSDARGRFVWRLAPGSYRLTAVLEDRRSSPTDVTVRAGQVLDVELRLP